MAAGWNTDLNVHFLWPAVLAGKDEGYYSSSSQSWTYIRLWTGSGEVCEYSSRAHGPKESKYKKCEGSGASAGILMAIINKRKEE